METWTRKTYPLQQNGRRKLTIVRCIGYEEKEHDHVSIPELKNGPNWFLTDDKYVVRCYRVVAPWKTKVQRNQVWRFWTDMGLIEYVEKTDGTIRISPCNFVIFKHSGYRPVAGKNEYRKLYRGRRGRMFAKAYVAMILSGKKVNWELLGRIIMPNDANLVARALKTIKYWEIERMVDKELISQLEESGITFKNAIDKMEEAYAVAKAKKDAQTMVRVAEDYIEIYKKNQKASPYDTLPELEGPSATAALEKAERQLAGIPEPTSDAKLRASIVEYEEVLQEDLIKEAEKLLIKPTIGK